MKRYLIVYLPFGEQIEDTRKYKTKKGAKKFLENNTFRYSYNDITKAPYVSSMGIDENNWARNRVVPKYLFEVVEVEDV